MAQSADSSRKWTLAEKALAVISALLAVATAYLGLQTAKVAQAKQQAQAAVVTKDTDLSSLQNQFNQLRDRYTQLQSENGQLRSQLGLPGPTGGPTPGASVRHSGQLVLAEGGSSVDLDSPSSNTQWQGDQGDFYCLPRKSICAMTRAPYIWVTRRLTTVLAEVGLVIAQAISEPPASKLESIYASRRKDTATRRFASLLSLQHRWRLML
jgi:hypothetical protein